MAFEIDKDAARRIRAAFVQVLESAVPAYELKQLGLFDSESERFIGNEVERKLYEPELPCGGQREEAIVEKLQRYKDSMDKNWQGHGWTWRAIECWKTVCPPAGRRGASGWYYQQRPLNEKMHKQQYEWLQTLHSAAVEMKDFPQKWFSELMLKGLPERVADFRMECLFLLEKPDGEVERLVRLRNVMGEATEIITLNADALHAPQKFRHWCLTRGNYNWGAGEKELQKLHVDVARSVAYRKVHQIVACGWRAVKSPLQSKGAATGGQRPGETRAKRGIWFFDDCAVAEGKLILPDEYGICWFEEEGYLLSERGLESEFFQKRPKMFPNVLPPGALKEMGYDAIGAFFNEFCFKMYETLGGYEGWMFVGSMLAYAAAPEIYDKYSQFPGLWIHGQGSSGKTTLCEIMMGLWGFDLQKGLDLIKNVTPVGMLMAAGQYSNLPVWLDEYRQAEVDADKVAILRSAFNRGEQAKWSADGKQRKIQTAFLVSGESTTQDYATRSRYPHIQVSSARRVANHLEWFKANARYFFLFTRHLLERRQDFAEMLMKQLKQWRESESNAGVQERDKLVHGVSYAAWCVASMMMESHGPEELAKFRGFMVVNSRHVSEDIQTELNINLFWQDLITAFRAEVIPASCFRVELKMLPHAPDRENQVLMGDLEMGWPSYTLFLEPESVIKHMEIYLAKARGALTLKRKDLRDQLSQTPYWVQGKLRKRFETKSGACSAAWGIRVDQHPMGYQMVTDEEYLVAREARFTDGDPRKGDLYAIVEAVERARKAAAGAKTE